MSSETESVFTYVNDSIINEFSGNGSESLITLLNSAEQDAKQKEEIASQIFVELLLSLDEDKLNKQDLIQFLQVAIKDEIIAVVFCEVFESFPLSPSLQNLIISIEQKGNILKLETTAKYISAEKISKSGLVPPEILNKQLNIRKRDDFYTQKKYNLIHEELEGYSKLITELYSILKLNEGTCSVDYALRVTESIVGHFDLDPNRVLDVLFEVFASNFIANHEFVLEYFKKSRWWPETPSDCHTSIFRLSEGGSETAARIIGLRLSKHPKDKDLPDSIKVLIACLINVGFLSVGSFYKYLSPDDNEMKQLEEQYNKSLQEQAFKASASALALAAPLNDDEGSTPAQSFNEKADKGENFEATLEQQISSNLKLQFLKAFLGNGLYFPSLFILSQYPFLANLDNEISELINRLFERMIDPLYNSIKTLGSEELLILQKPQTNTNQLRVGASGNSNNRSSIDILSFKPALKNFNSKRFYYFYSKWDSNLPTIGNIPDLFTRSKEILKFNVINLHKSPELFSKLCDIAIQDLKENESSDSRKGDWFNYFRNFMYAAIPLFEENPIIIDKAYSLLSYFSSEERYNLYSEMHQVISKNNVFIKIASGKAEKKTRDILKRLSKENVSAMMRKLAKISFSNPLPCFLVILQQIESYDNLISLVVDTARYFNNFGWDAMTLAVLMRLTQSGRSNTQADGLNTRQWLSSLSSFIGQIAKRYPNSFDLKSLLSYLLKTLHSNESIAVVVLREILTSMGGIQNLNNLSLKQIEMIGSGKSLEKMVYDTIGDMRHASVKSGTILVKTLVDLDEINELIILLDKFEIRLLQDESQKHLKILTNQLDELISVKHLLITVVSLFGNSEAISKLLLPIDDLNSRFHVSTEWIFELYRSLRGQCDSESYFESLMNLTEKTKAFLPMNSSLRFPKELFSIFWGSRLYDLNFSHELYTSELEKLKSSIISVKENIAFSRKDKDVSKNQIESLRKRLRDNEQYVKRLPEELDLHREWSLEFEFHIKEIYKNWFSSETNEGNDICSDFLQYCVLPRAVHSPIDAVYSATFMFYLQKIGTPAFDIRSILEKLMKGRLIYGTLFTCTYGEAENLGIFFFQILNTLNKWSDKEFFQTNLKGTFKAENGEVPLTGARSLVYEYQKALLDEICDALESKEYMCCRNVITFLKHMVMIYPSIEGQCDKLLYLITNLNANEDREDLKLSSSALIGHLKSRSKHWIPLWEFIEMSSEEKKAYQEELKNYKDSINRIEIERNNKKIESKLKDRVIKESLSGERKIASIYDGSTSVKSRSEVRNDDGKKNRYDYYSKYNKDNGETPVKNKVEDAPDSKNSSVPNKESISQSSASSEEKQEALVIPSAMAETTKTKQIQVNKLPADNKATDLKARIMEAKKELNLAKKSDNTSKDAKFSTSSSKDKEIPKTNSSDSEPVNKVRKALPPQDYIAKYGVSDSKQEKGINRRYSESPYNNNSRNSRKGYYSTAPQNRYPTHRPQSQGGQLAKKEKQAGPNHVIPPPPPPPPPPTASSSGHSNSSPGIRGSRHDNKRRFDYPSGSREYDKRHRS